MHAGRFLREVPEGRRPRWVTEAEVAVWTGEQKKSDSEHELKDFQETA
jgi:hypothetical protein